MDFLLFGTLYSANYASVDTVWARTHSKIVETMGLCFRRHAGHKCHTFLCSLLPVRKSHHLFNAYFVSFIYLGTRKPSLYVQAGAHHIRALIKE